MPNGLYQLLFLFIFGNLIPLNTPGLVIKGSTGVANTIDLTYGSGGGIKYALDGLWKLSFGPALYICCGVIAALLVVLMLTKRLNAKKGGIFHRHSGGGLPAVSDPRGGLALQHGHGAPWSPSWWSAFCACSMWAS